MISCYSVLGISQDEEAAFHCKIICYIQLSKFNDALQAITRSPKLATYDNIILS